MHEGCKVAEAYLEVDWLDEDETHVASDKSLKEKPAVVQGC